MNILLSHLESPVYVWVFNKILRRVTYGKEELKKVLIEEGLFGIIEKVDAPPGDDWYHKFYRLVHLEGKEIGKYKLIDSQYLVSNRIILDNLEIFYTNDNIVILSDKQIPELYFTAPDGENGCIKNEIENGRHLIRNIKHYVKIKKDKGGKYDPTEGILSGYYLDRVTLSNGKDRFKFCDSYVLLEDKVDYNFFIFSFHDKNIIEKEKNKFGSNTYKIKDILGWIEGIYKEIFQIFRDRAKSTGTFFLGSIIFLKKVDYSGKKIKKIINRTIHLDPEKYPEIGRGKDFKEIFEEEAGKFDSIPRENIREYLERLCFQKTPEYKGQSEYRLVVYPFFLDKKGKWIQSCNDEELNLKIRKEFFNQNLQKV